MLTLPFAFMTVEQAIEMLDKLESIRLFASGVLMILCIHWGDKLITQFRSVSSRNNWFRAAGDRL